jgi:hypothetical protein
MAKLKIREWTRNMKNDEERQYKNGSLVYGYFQGYRVVLFNKKVYAFTPTGPRDFNKI